MARAGVSGEKVGDISEFSLSFVKGFAKRAFYPHSSPEGTPSPCGIVYDSYIDDTFELALSSDNYPTLKAIPLNTS